MVVLSRFIKLINLLFLVLILITLLASCSDREGKEQSGGKQLSEEQQKRSDKLKEIEKNVESLISMLSGIPEEELERLQEKQEMITQTSQGQQGEQQGKQQEGQQSGEQEQDTQQGDQQKQKGKEQNKQQGGQQTLQEQQRGVLQPKPPVNWQEALSIVEKLHTLLNEFVTDASKAGITSNDIEGFSKVLNTLTNQIKSKNRVEATLIGNDLYFYISNFWTSYNPGVLPDLKRLKHYLQSVIFYSETLDWIKTNYFMDKSINQLQSLARASIDKEKQDSLNRLDFSIQELNKVVKQKNPLLIKIKGKLAVDNIRKLEREIEGGSVSEQ